jgi:transposase
VGQLAKTDRIDAQLIARFGRDAHPEERPLSQENQRLLGDFAARNSRSRSIDVSQVGCDAINPGLKD